MNTRSVQRALNSILGPRPTNGEEPSMRIGKDFQAEVPELHSGGIPSEGTGSVLVWAPNYDIRGENVDAYLNVAKEQFGFNIEQALGLLFWHKYRIEKAVEDLPNFCPLQAEWTMEDKVTFEQAFHFHGKNFQRIRAMLPDKPISSLVKYYYLWKKSYSQYSLMDKHARKNCKRISFGLPVSNDDTDSNKSGSSRSENQPPFSLPLFILTGKGKQLPKGIHLSTAELVSLAGDSDRLHVKQLDRDIMELKDKVQWNKQQLMRGKEEVGGDGIEELRPSDFTRKAGLGGPTRWSEEEIQVALEVIQQHGKDYEALASTLENKTLAQCRNFFTNYKRKLNLPRLIAEYELRHGQKLSRYSKQAKDFLENGVQGEGEGDGVGVDVGYQGGLLLEAGPQTKRLRLGNSGLEYGDANL